MKKPSHPVAMTIEPLEDRRMMSVGTVQDQGAVRLETSLGRITLLLTPNVTPTTVANFLKNYVNKSLYDNTIITRSVPGFVIQLGGYKADASNNFPTIPRAEDIPPEFTAAQAAANAAGRSDVNVRGTVAIALSGTTNDTGNSEFFINLADNAHSPPQSGQDDNGLDVQNGGFTPFATVIGGGMHVADAIANLQVVNSSSLNAALTDLPVIRTTSGNNPVVVSSAKAQRVLPVTLDAKTKFVTWKDEKGGTATISLSKGTADLTFVGGTDMVFEEHGNRVVITGKNVDLEEVTTHHTNHSSVLAVKSVGGFGPAHIGDITVVGGSLGKVDASNVQLQGDLTAADGAIDSINLQSTFRSVITIKSGTTAVHVDKALDTSIKTGGTIKSLVANTWFDDGEVATSITAKALGSMRINGNFSSNLTVTGDVGLIKINGNVGTLGASNWVIAGNVKSIQVGKVMGLGLTAGKNIASFHAREVNTDSSTNTATRIIAGTIGTMNLATLTNGSSISSISTAKNGATGIKSITIARSMDSSTIRSNNNIGAVIVGGSLTGTQAASSTPGDLAPSGIYAGVVSTFSGSPVTLPASFNKNSAATIGRLRVGATFSNTNIAAPILSNLSLGKVRAAGTTHFGVTAHIRIGQVLANVKSKAVVIGSVSTEDQIDAKLAALKLANDGAFAGNRFTLKIV